MGKGALSPQKGVPKTIVSFGDVSVFCCITPDKALNTVIVLMASSYGSKEYRLFCGS